MKKFHGGHFVSAGGPFKPGKRGFKIFTLADGHQEYTGVFTKKGEGSYTKHG